MYYCGSEVPVITSDMPDRQSNLVVIALDK